MTVRAPTVTGAPEVTAKLCHCATHLSNNTGGRTEETSAM